MTMKEAIASAQWETDERKATGFDQVALDEAARQGFADGAFEESEEDGAAVVEEFFPDESEGEPPASHKSSGIKPGLAAKLNQKVERLKGNGASIPVTLADQSQLHGPN